MKRESLLHNVPLVSLISEGLGVGGVIGVYGFFALITPTKSEKLSRCVASRRFDMVMFLPMEPKLIGESKPDVEADEVGIGICGCVSLVMPQHCGMGHLLPAIVAAAIATASVGRVGEVEARLTSCKVR
jgi:hypothetical protein